MPGGKSGCCLCAFRHERAVVRLDNRAAALSGYFPTKCVAVNEIDDLLLIFVRTEVSARIFGWQYIYA